MKLEQLTQSMAATLASLFLILSLCVLSIGRTSSTGIHIPLLRLDTRTGPLIVCGDGRTIVVTLSKNMLKINQDETSMESVGTTIGNIMQDRADRIVYIIAEPQAQYGDVARLLGKLANSASDTHLALLSGELRRSIYEQRIDISCELKWPRSEFNTLGP